MKAKQIYELVKEILQAGANVVLTPNDTNKRIQIASSGVGGGSSFPSKRFIVGGFQNPSVLLVFDATTFKRSPQVVTLAFAFSTVGVAASATRTIAGLQSGNAHALDVNLNIEKTFTGITTGGNPYLPACYDPSTDKFYTHSSTNLVQIDGSTLAVVTLGTIASTDTAIAVGASQIAVSIPSSNLVRFFNGTTGALIGDVTSVTTASGICYNADKNRFVVARNAAGAGVREINPTGYATNDFATGLAATLSVAYGANTYCVGRSTSIVVVNSTTGATIGTAITTLGAVRSIVFGNGVFCCHDSAGYVHFVDPATGAALAVHRIAATGVPTGFQSVCYAEV